MTKEEFLDEIKKELGFMPYEEVIKAEKYFESYFNGSEADEKVIETATQTLNRKRKTVSEYGH